MNPMRSFKHSIPFKVTLSLFCTLSFFFSIPNFEVQANSGQEQEYDALLMTEHTVVSLCGELNYKRQGRNCIEAPNLKQCLELNERDPLFIYQQTTSYSCVNTSYSAGVEIIKDKLEQSQQSGGCLAGNFRRYYNEVVQSNEFNDLSAKFEENLGLPLKLNYGIDTKDGLFNLQMDTSELEGTQMDMINISIGNFSESGHCQKISSREIMAKITDEYNRLSLKVAHEDYDYYGDQPMSAKVFDASRFGDKVIPSQNKRATASTRESEAALNH